MRAPNTTPLGDSATAPLSDAAEQAIGAYESENASRLRTGLGMIAVGVCSGAGALWARATGAYDTLTHELPFVPAVQEAVNNVDDALASTGTILFPAALAAVGAAKIAASISPRWRMYDTWSSQELSDDSNPHPSVLTRGLRRVAAGTLPGVAAAGVALGTFTAGISAEVSEGPSRPIEALDTLARGDAMVVQYAGAMPMVESYVNPKISQQVRAEASRRGIPATSFDLSLGTYTYRGDSRDHLAIGIEAGGDSPLTWNASRGCADIPVMIDKTSGIGAGEKLEMNGLTVRVVAQTEDISAINRIGVVLDEGAMKTCLKQNAEAGSHAVVLDADQKTAEDILAIAVKSNPDIPATIITKQNYQDNSHKFWESNVQPITNVLALVSGGVTLVSMAGIMGGRLLRNRRQWAAKLAAGVSEGQLRTTEILRSTKDGILASAVGVGAAVAVTPVANMLEYGFKAGIGVREALVGVGLGVMGSVAGGVTRLLRLKKLVNPSQHTRI